MKPSFKVHAGVALGLGSVPPLASTLTLPPGPALLGNGKVALPLLVPLSRPAHPSTRWHSSTNSVSCSPPPGLLSTAVGAIVLMAGQHRGGGGRQEAGAHDTT